MKICVVSPSYPTQGPNKYPFVENLCNAWADMGHQITVITPVRKLNRLAKGSEKYEYKQVSYQSEKGSVTVLTPEYITIGKFPLIGERFNNCSIRRCIEKTIRKNNIQTDVFYAHFWRCGLYVYESARRRQVPLYVATGESQIKIPTITDSYKREFASYVKGVISVSTKNKNESINLELTVDEKCIVLPNAINAAVFHQMDKKVLRTKFGFPEDAFIVAFVGYFIHRKGPKRVCEAIEQLHNPNIKTIFIGSSANQVPEEPYGDSIIFKGVLSHEKIAEYLNCADVFVLPTLHEGCCNAIIEAMACGLPIISSDREFNYDVLDESNSIMVDPKDVSQIAASINRLCKDEALRKRLSDGALVIAAELNITKRAEKIIRFLDIEKRL